jgi:hypothetical protein
MEHESVETSMSRIWLDENGILHTVNRPGCCFDLAAAKESVSAARKFLKGRKVPIAVDLRGTQSISRPARQYYASEEGAFAIVATALIVASPVEKIIGNFFIGLHKPQSPVKLFAREDEAVEWLKGFLP